MMNTSFIRHNIVPIAVLTAGILSTVLGHAARFGGGFHPNIGGGAYHYDNGFHENNIGVGNYHPGAGWVAPAYIINNNAINYGADCQSISQCDDDGTCIQTQDCN